MNLSSTPRRLLAVIFFALTFISVARAGNGHPDIAAHFVEAGVEGCFVLLPGDGSEAIRYQPACTSTRRLPASTFKIPNTLIAIETGVASGPGFELKWIPERDPRQEWWPVAWAGDHDLGSALKHSVVWFYKELARRIGAGRMQDFLDRFGYGNRDISGGIDRFWLDGGLRISPDEQVAFLRRFYSGQLGLSTRTTTLVKSMLVLEEDKDYRLSGKTGWVMPDDKSSPQTGWLVGYVERNGKVWFFATCLQMRSSAEAAKRVPMTRAILREFGLLP
jgi:beta-lactamase class D